MLEVSGSIQLNEPVGPGVEPVVRVWIEEARLAGDRAPAVLAESVFMPPAGFSTTLPFSIACDDLEDAGSAQLRVHVDLDGTGVIAEGDYLNMQSFVIPMRRGHITMDIEVCRVS